MQVLTFKHVMNIKIKVFLHSFFVPGIQNNVCFPFTVHLCSHKPHFEYSVTTQWLPYIWQQRPT